MSRAWLFLAVMGALGLSVAGACAAEAQQNLKYRWVFVWRQLSRPEEVDKLIADLPRAAAAGYNGLVLRWNVAPEKKEALKAAAAQYHFDLIPTVMGSGAPERDLMEGLPVRDALFVAHNGTATISADPAVSLPGGEFEEAKGDTFAGWDSQEQPGVCTFQDTEVKHGGASAIRMDNLAKASPDLGCYVGKTLKVSPFREYRVSVWVKTDQLEAEEPGVIIRGEGGSFRNLCYSPARIRPTQDWRQLFLVFNSLDNTSVRISFGAWAPKSGRLWWDDAKLEEVGLLNVVRRAGTPVTVKGENGTVYEEGKDYEAISDPDLNISRAGHAPPVIHLTPMSRITEGQRLRVSYYHPVLIEYGGAACLAEPKLYEHYREEITRINDEIHPPAFFMSHDEIRIANWCETCRGKHETPGQLLADGVKQCVDIIRAIRPDAKIWVWSDMFDPFHNAHEKYYLVNGTWAASWEGLPKEVGIANWAGHLAGKNCYWFAMRGHEQVLCGYYDNPEDNNGEKMRAWLKAGEGTSVVGAMYTTWRSSYDPLVTWAEGVWGKPRQPGK